MTNTNEGKSSTIERFPSFVKLFRTLLNSCKLKIFILLIINIIKIEMLNFLFENKLFFIQFCDENLTKISENEKTLNNDFFAYDICGILICSNFTRQFQNIIVSDFSGNIVGSVSDVNRSSIVVPASSVNIKEPGVYFLQIETVSGMATKKFVLK